jgi:hypothetical protein
MRHGAVDYPLEACGGLGVAMGIQHEAGELVVDIAGQFIAEHFEVDVAGAHYRGSVAVVDQGEKQMLQSRVLVAALVGILQGTPESLLETGRKRSHLSPHSFSIVHCSGCSC